MRGCAFIQMLRDEHAAAAQLLHESLELCRSSDDTRGLAWSRYALAFVQLAQGDLAQARGALEDVLVDMQQQGMTFGVFRTLLALGHTLFAQGDIVGAEVRYREGLAISREVPMLTIITIGLDGLAMVAAAKGLPLRAARLWGAAEALREVTDERRWHIFQRPYDRALAAARAQVSETEWVTAWAAGRTLTAAEALAEALEDGDKIASSSE